MVDYNDSSYTAPRRKLRKPSQSLELQLSPHCVGDDQQAPKCFLWTLPIQRDNIFFSSAFAQQEWILPLGAQKIFYPSTSAGFVSVHHLFPLDEMSRQQNLAAF